MTEIIYKPEGPLSGFVKFMWFQEGYEPSARIERVLPTGSTQIILNLGDKPFRHYHSDLKTQTEFNELILTGIHLNPVFLDSSTRISTIGIVLEDGAVPALFHMPATVARNHVVDFKCLRPSGLSELTEKLQRCSAPAEKLRVFEKYLSRQIQVDQAPSPAIRYAIGRIRNTNGMVQMSEILRKTGFTRRWFTKQFRESVGVNPKTFARISRFQHTLDLLQNNESPDFISIALECGYYDQSHFIHDFKELSGISPSVYHLKQGKEKNHIPA